MTPSRPQVPTASEAHAAPGNDRVPAMLRYVSFNQLRSFHAVACAGSVTRAAQMLHVSQPTVTIQLRQLESSYGVELVHRNRGGLQLTDVGRELFAISERIFALEKEAVDLLQNASGLLTGHLRVGGVGPFFVMQLLAEFSHRYPAIQLSLALGNSEDALTDLLEYRNDVAVVGRPAGKATGDTRLVVVPFSCQRVVFCVSREHHWADRHGVRLADLAGEPLIMREPGSISRLALEEALASANVDANVVLEVNREGVWEAAAAGLGIGVTTDAEFRPDDRLAMVHVLDADVETEAIVVGLRDRQEAPLVRAFMDIAKELAHSSATNINEQSHLRSVASAEHPEDGSGQPDRVTPRVTR
jgi:aminoethylphosphonate catabolism LysR family transcriptional regulator